jgi:hypothetical protein
MKSMQPLAAVVEQAANTLVVCFCEEIVDYEVNGSVFRRLVLPPQLHACLNDSLDITAQCQANKQRLAGDRIDQESMGGLQARVQHKVALPGAELQMQCGDRRCGELADVATDSDRRLAEGSGVIGTGPRQSVAFGHIQQLRSPAARSPATVFPVSAMRASGTRVQDGGLSAIG